VYETPRGIKNLGTVGSIPVLHSQVIFGSQLSISYDAIIAVDTGDA
jgi:hypothetical protein